MPAKRINHKRRAVLGLVAVAVLVAGGTAAARAMSGNGSDKYRTATATMGSVDQLLTGVGTVASVNQVSVAFPVSGTVATVPVTVGSKVSAGQTLATLSTTSLNQSVNSANSTLATAQQTLATDQASQTESTATESSVELGTDGESTDSVGAIRLTAAVTSTSPSARPTAPTGGGAPTGGTGSTTGSSSVKQLIAQITTDQKAVIAAQQKLDQDLADAESALTTCQNALSTTSAPPTSTPPTTTPPTTSTPTDSATPTATASATVSAAASTPAADSGDATCLAAIAAAPTKADAAGDQQTRDAAEQTLDAAIAKLEKAASSSGNSTGGGTTGGTGNGGSGNGGSTGTGTGGKTSGGSTSGRAGTGSGFPSGSTGTGSGSTSSRTGSGNQSSGSGQSGSGQSSSGQSGSRTSTGPASAAQLAADQAQIDAAQAQLVVAQQNLKAATLTSPLTGTVASVSITAGKNAGSSSSITVIGTGQSQVTTTVALTDIDKVKVGDPATVKVDGISAGLTGKVSLIGIMNTSTGSSTAYPVTILLDATSQKLYDGSGASTSIQIAKVSNVLTVPSSAVRSLGQLKTVSVLTNGKPVTTRVTVGAVGTDQTQILSGLKAGQQVVLADLNEKLPTSTS